MIHSRFPGYLAAVVTALILASPVAAQRSGKPLLEQVARAMGGKDKVLGIRTLIIEGAGKEYNVGQNASPDADLGAYEVTGYRRALDFAGRRWQQEQTREPRFPAGNPAPQRQRIAYDSVAFDLAADNTPRRVSPRADIDRRDELIRHPIGFVQAAFAEGTELTEERAISGLRHVRMNVGGQKYAMLVSPRTRLPARIDRIVHHPVLGDVLLSTLVSDWKRVDGIMLPMHVRHRLDGKWIISDLRLTSARVDADVGDLTAPSSVRAVLTAAAPVNVANQVIAPGVWYLSGQSHHSVAIEMKDHLLLVEAPQSEARTIAVMQRARTLGNGKPLRSVIVTHHHFDHIGGVRAAIAGGLNVITHSKNVPFIQSLARRQHSIVEDTLAKTKTPARVQGVATKEVISDSTRTVEIHHVRGNPHSETMLMVYLPAEKLLIEADAYTPPAADATSRPAAPFAKNLLDNIERLELDVEYVVPLHGRIVPISDLRAAVQASATEPPSR